MRKTKKPKAKPDLDVTVIKAKSMPELLEKTVVKIQEINAKHFEAWLDDVMSKVLPPDLYLAVHASGEKFQEKVRVYMEENEIALEMHPDGRARVRHKEKVVSVYKPMQGVMAGRLLGGTCKEFDGS